MKVSSSADSSCGLVARTRLSQGRQRAAAGCAASAASISASSSALISSVSHTVGVAMAVIFSRRSASNPCAAASSRWVEADRKAKAPSAPRCSEACSYRMTAWFNRSPSSAASPRAATSCP